MKLTIIENKENLLLKRNELSGTLEFEGATPSNSNVSSTLAQELKKDLKLIIVKHIYTNFSHQTAKFDAIVYENVEAKNKFEIVTKHMKKAAKEEKKKADEAAKVATEEKAKAAETSAEEPTNEDKAVEENLEVKEESAPETSKEPVANEISKEAKV
jgi:ribosomal protein S24E